MKITVLGGCGGWPTTGEACSGFLVEHDGFRILLDLGYSALPRLLQSTRAEQIDAVLVSHEHPDHCADVNPLLRARALQEEPAPTLPLYTLPGALDAVLALDRPDMLAGAFRLCNFDAGDRFEVGPFTVETRLLPHWVPNAGMRLSAGGRTLAYTGDGGPSPDMVALACDADLLVAEATYVDQVPKDEAPYLTSALQVGQQATAADAARVLPTHLWPGTDAAKAQEAARKTFHDQVELAAGGLTVELDRYGASHRRPRLGLRAVQSAITPPRRPAGRV